jgi:hypothetical protein
LRRIDAVASVCGTWKVLQQRADRGLILLQLVGDLLEKLRALGAHAHGHVVDHP